MIAIAEAHPGPSGIFRRIFAKSPIFGIHLGFEYASGLWCDNIINIGVPFFPWANGTSLKALEDR